jgi:peptide/nickel transport system permease protein
VTRYVLKRLLLIPPTFFLVSLVIFAILNIAPGRPGEHAQDEGQAVSSESQESFRIFREQFHLDKPILLNTRFLLDTSAVRALLIQGTGLAEGTPIGDRLRARERLDDYGNALVPGLMDLAVLHPDADARVVRNAARQLTVAARKAAGLQGAMAHNKRIRGWRWDAEDGRARVQQAWRRWWEAERDHYVVEGAEIFASIFLDTRFANYWRNLLRLDFGASTVDRRPVRGTIISKLKYSLSLTLVSMVLAYLIAVPLGVLSAVKQGTIGDALITTSLFVLYSLPTFFTGTVLLRLLAEGDPVAWFPTGGFSARDNMPRTTLAALADIAWHLVLPVVTYTAVTLAALSRYARAGVMDVIRADYVRTARAKGLHEFLVIVKHAARNGMIPILTLLGSLLPVLVSGSVVVEVVFGIPGMGLYLYDAINLRDYNAVMGVLVAASLLTLLGMLVSDVCYALADPRIRF